MAESFYDSFIQSTGYFWSGCAGACRYGLEIAGFASIGMESRTALHLYARQTVGQETFDSLLDYYASLVRANAKGLKSVSHILVADAYFSRKCFVEAVIGQDMQLVSKLRADAVLQYCYQGPRRKGRGRPKVYEGKVDKSKDLDMDGARLLDAYRLRFQIEFLYRDAKQHMGLNHCQARSKEKIHTHVNASLTAVSIAKVAHYLSLPSQQRGAFSISSITTQYFNEHLLHRFFMEFGMDPETHKNSQSYKELFQYGCIAA